MPIPLYTEIAKCKRFIQELFSIDDDRIAIKDGTCIISENGELVFSNNKPRSLQESLSFLIEFFHVIEEVVARLSERRNHLQKIMKKSKSLEEYIDKEDRGRYKETSDKARYTLSDLMVLTDGLQKMLRIKEENLDFCRKEAMPILLEIYREIAPVLKKYHNPGIPIDPIVINVKIEVMDIH